MCSQDAVCSNTPFPPYAIPTAGGISYLEGEEPDAPGTVARPGSIHFMLRPVSLLAQL
jgi:hypothetical protein